MCIEKPTAFLIESDKPILIDGFQVLEALYQMHKTRTDRIGFA